jgi:hypothetical protein
VRINENRITKKTNDRTGKTPPMPFRLKNQGISTGHWRRETLVPGFTRTSGLSALNALNHDRIDEMRRQDSFDELATLNARDEKYKFLSATSRSYSPA